MSSLPRFLLVTVLLTTTAILLQRRNAGENLPSHQALSSFPKALRDWVGRDLAIDQDVREMLGDGDFLLRSYRNTESGREVNLFVAYIPSQRGGNTLHSPQNCIPGAGWSPLASGRTMISLPGRSPFAVNRYVVEKNDDRQLVLYWYSAHGRTVASEYWAKFYLVEDSIRFHNSDGSLVRIITPIPHGESARTVEQRLLDFSAQAVPALDPYIS